MFLEAMNYQALKVHEAHQLGSLLQPPHSFFSTQNPETLHFYLWVVFHAVFLTQGCMRSSVQLQCGLEVVA